MAEQHRRADRVAEAIREEVALFLRNDAKDPRISPLVTVTGCEVTRDLRHAKVFVSVMGSDEERKQTFEGLAKSVFFGAAIALISCYKGFTCGAGAQGVGRACTESFVASFIAIIVLNFFFAKVAKDWYIAIYGVRSVLG